MNYDHHPSPDEAFPVLSSLDHTSDLTFTPSDSQLTDPTLSLTFVTDHSILDPSLSAFVASYPSETSSPDTLSGFDLTSLAPPGVTPTLPGDSFPYPALSQLSSSTSTVRDGPGIPSAEPWTSIAVTCQPMTDHPYRQEVDVKQSRNFPSKLPTDSGYGDSLRSAQLMKGNARRQAPSGQIYPEDGDLETRMRQVLPDKQLMGASLPRARISPSTASGPALDVSEKFQCTQCKMSFTTHSEHQKHMARHEKKWVCNYPSCTRISGFATSNDLERHRKGVHKMVGLSDQVWKCLVDGCRTSEKIWTRQDNFRAHIDRMHKEVDVDEYVQRSERWFEEVEKPRRHGELPSSTSQSQFDVDDPTGPFQYSGAMTEQTYPESRVDVSEYPSSVAGEFPDTRAHAGWDTSPQDVNPYPDHVSRFSQAAFHGAAGLGRSVSNNPNLSLSSMNPSGIRNDPALPSSYRDEDFLAAFHNPGTESANYVNVMGPIKARTLPDLDRSGLNYLSEWQHNDFDTSSPRLDVPGTVLQPESATDILSYVGGDNYAQPIITYSESDVLGHGSVSNTDLGVADSSPTVEQLAEKSDQDHQQEINNFLKKITNPMLRQKLSENIAKTIKEHSSSKSVNISGTSVHPSAAPSSSSAQDLPHWCSRPGCSKKFAKRNRLTKHEKRHDRVFFCTFDNCYKRFGTKTDLSRHEYRVHHQAQAWRCWTTNRSRDKNKECAELFNNEADFEAHRKERHSKVKSTLDDFKIDQDFAGAFWCGFCNAVVKNPKPLDVTGTARVNHRYLHIEYHMNDIYIKTPGRDAMKEWYELGGRGATKAEAKDAAKLVKTYIPEDDSDDDDDGDEGSPQTPIVNMVSRQRSSTASSQPRYSQYLSPSDAHATEGSRKRPAPFVMPEHPNWRGVKSRKIESPASAMSAPQRPRHLSISSVGRSSPRPVQQAQSQVIDASNANAVVAYIKCCRCKAPPRLSNGTWTCPDCWQRNCEHCEYFGRDRKLLHVVFGGTMKSSNSVGI